MECYEAIKSKSLQVLIWSNFGNTLGGDGQAAKQHPHWAAFP